MSEDLQKLIRDFIRVQELSPTAVMVFKAIAEMSYSEGVIAANAALLARLDKKEK